MVPDPEFLIRYTSPTRSPHRPIRASQHHLLPPISCPLKKRKNVFIERQKKKKQRVLVAVR